MSHWIKCNIRGIPRMPRSDITTFDKSRHSPAIAAFQQAANTTHLSIKKRSFGSAWREFVRLYKPTQFFCEHKESRYYRDDSVQVWFTT